MKKFFSLVLAFALAFTVAPTNVFAQGENTEAQPEPVAVTPAACDADAVACIGEVGYATLRDAVMAVHEKTTDRMTETTVVLQKDVVDGQGIAVGYEKFDAVTGVTGGNNPVSIVLDLNGKTYTVNKDLVGSSSTTSNGFQLLKGSSVTIKNGALRMNSNRDTIFIQNYSNLKLENVDINASENANISYVMSNNYGNITISGNTNIIAAEGQQAFDLWYGLSEAYKEGVNLTFDATYTGTVKGNVEYGSQNNNAPDWKKCTILNFAAGNKGVYDVTIVPSTSGVTNLDGSNINVASGTFSCDVKPFIANAESYAMVDGKYVAGTTYEVKEAVKKATNDVELLKGEFGLVDINATVNFKNSTEKPVFVNGVELDPSVLVYAVGDETTLNTLLKDHANENFVINICNDFELTKPVTYAGGDGNKVTINGYRHTIKATYTGTTGNQSMLTVTSGEMFINNLILEDSPKYGVQVYKDGSAVFNDLQVNNAKYGGVLLNGCKNASVTKISVNNFVPVIEVAAGKGTNRPILAANTVDAFVGGKGIYVDYQQIKENLGEDVLAGVLANVAPIAKSNKIVAYSNNPVNQVICRPYDTHEMLTDLKKAENLDLTLYRNDEAMDTFKAAYKAAKEAFANPFISEAEMTKARTDLNNAINGLKLLDTTMSVKTEGILSEDGKSYSVMLISDEELKTPEGWNAAAAGNKAFHKVFTKNGSYEFVIEDLAGNKMTITVVVNGIVEEGKQETSKPAPAPQVEAPKAPAYDDGGPFTTDECGSVYDRWGNQLWKSPVCKAQANGNYNLVNTSDR